MSTTNDTARTVRPNAMLVPPKLILLLRSMTCLAEGICDFEFVAPDGADLPPFTAGAHIDVFLANGCIRQYSLCNDPAERHRYVIAVLRDAQGRGGSLAMHDKLRVGTLVSVSVPRNHFALVADTSRYVFVAGGIGITPIMSMIAAAHFSKHDFHLYYATRSPLRTAFLPQLQALIETGHVTLHHDEGVSENGLDFSTILATPQPDTHLYCCGPSGFLDAVLTATAGWPSGTVHVERFSAPPASSRTAAESSSDVTFDIKLAKSGQTFTVAPGNSIVDVLQAHGVDVEVSCQEGYCGTCMTRYLAGEPLHRDTVLDEEDRKQFMMICCSRAVSDVLVLDL